MFREIKKKKNEISMDEAKALLSSARRGVLSVNGDEGYPYGVPVNYLYDQEEGKIYFHGSASGHKADAIAKDNRVCFTVIGEEQIKDETWAPYLKSVVAFGRCRILEDREEIISRLRKFASKYYPNREMVEDEIVMSGDAVSIFEITIEHISGKQVQER